jgi:glycosyltransferase involved in cell wall biosynthesis
VGNDNLSDEINRFAMQCAFISTEPKILLMAMDIGETGYRKFSDGSISLQHIFDIVGPSGHVIINPWWSIPGDDIWAKRLSDIKHLAEARPETIVHFFCNSDSEVSFLREMNFRAILMNHNTFCNENVFTVMSIDKSFDAIYNAKLIPFKRHHLAKDIKSLALLYSRFGDQGEYFKKLKAMLPEAQFLNGDPGTASYVTFNSARVTEYLNRARVGLCLSKVEGGMYASIEYLLSGLCVVSTKSSGGREVFFDSRFCRIADDNPASVSEAVNDLIASQIDPHFVRNETLVKVEASRRRFIDYIDDLQRLQGYESGGEKAFRRIMAGPWSCWSYKTIAEIRRYFGG